MKKFTRLKCRAFSHWKGEVSVKSAFVNPDQSLLLLTFSQV